MCGIAGLLYFDAQREVDAGLLDRMTDVLAHRGPDGRGTHRDGPLGLGHRRLAIIDLSPDAAQPMANEDDSVWVVLNGEIYNFQELRAELEGKGHTFRSHSDTEVLVHLYEEEGDALVSRLRGMFAFALWDAKRKHLLLARDRFGQKPLYYRLSDRSLHFASEIKGILQDPEVERRPDLRGLHTYLTYGYVPGPLTAFEGIASLPPGHTLSVELDGSSKLERYWALSMTPKDAEVDDSPAGRRRAEARVRELIDEAVKLRMIADVPLGAFLSGGVDSSSIVASMCLGGSGAPKTFAIGFDEPAYDERAYAAEVATALRTEHEVLVLGPDSFTGLEQIVWHYNQPFADPSCLPTFAVSKLARQHVTVALSGDGGDELFVGYRRYLGTRMEERLRAGPAFPRNLARNRFLIEATRRAGFSDLCNELAHSRYNRNLPPSDLYLTRLESLSLDLKTRLYDPGPWGSLLRRDAREVVRRALAASDGVTFTERCAHADVMTYLPDDILVKVDVASMAHSLECRSPLLDHKLAEYVGHLPFALKMHRLETKRVLKDAMRDRLPRSILKRKKMGFGVPLEHWFRGHLGSILEETILSPRALARGYFQPAALRELVDQHTSKRADWQNPLFTLLMLELWHRQYIDPPAGDPLQRPS
ncbi:MAG: asparagine synthase (glutamine-hydrolyzing) [Planctomycetes bacterium]|nr:asparagine synthase (glutamine-hydrolyzing) [Planctomycetota bacterium]